MKNIILWFSLSIVLIFYFIYKNHKVEKILSNEVTYLKDVIAFKNNELNRYQKISEKVEAEKLELENKSILIIEKLNNALKSNKCSNDLVNSNVSRKLYDRANKIRQSVENTRKFTS